MNLKNLIALNFEFFLEKIAFNTIILYKNCMIRFLTATKKTFQVSSKLQISFWADQIGLLLISPKTVTKKFYK